MAEGAVTLVQAKDAGPGVGELGVAEVAVITLGLIDSGPHGHYMGMAVAREVGGVAPYALSSVTCC